MSNHLDFQAGLEPERYELTAPPRYCFEVDRREFFKFLGAGILVVCVWKDAHGMQESGSDKGARSIAAKGNWSLVAHRRRRYGDGLHRQSGGRAKYSDLPHPGYCGGAACARGKDSDGHG